MDPDVTLACLRRIANDILNNHGDAYEDAYDDAYELADLLYSLDTWISHGGFLPEDWSK